MVNLCFRLLTNAQLICHEDWFITNKKQFCHLSNFHSLLDWKHGWCWLAFKGNSHDAYHKFHTYCSMHIRWEYSYCFVWTFKFMIEIWKGISDNLTHIMDIVRNKRSTETHWNVLCWMCMVAFCMKPQGNESWTLVGHFPLIVFQCARFFCCISSWSTAHAADMLCMT